MNYTNERMKLTDVCEWLTKAGYEELGEVIIDKFTNHTWVKDGAIRTDVLRDIFERVYGTNDMFRAMECDVVTYMESIPDYLAHID